MNSRWLSKPITTFFVGMIATFAFAPYYLLPILPLALCFLTNKLFHSSSYKNSFITGWLFGTGYFLGGLYWFAYPLMLYFLSDYWWLVPFAFVLAPTLLGLYIALLASILHALKFLSAASFAICFACIWVVFEFLRTELFTGFPWLAAGYSLMKWTSIIQSASLFGIFGLSFLVVSLSSALFIFFSRSTSKTAKACVCGLIVLIFASNFLYGNFRLHFNKTALSERTIKIVQPNIYGLITRESMDTNATKILELVKLKESETEKLLYIVMPESALNFFTKQTFYKLIKSIPEQGYLIIGGDRKEYSGSTGKAWVSAFVFNREGTLIDSYDKTHLVPFGEYVPFRNFISTNVHAIVSTFLNDFVDFSNGIGPKTISVAQDFSFSPLICYESLFPSNIIDKKNPPNLLINFTTDMWYGKSSGPYQHFDMTVLRAVEYGIPLVRSSTTGISGVVDQYGRVLAKLELGKQGVLYYNIPVGTNNKTLYSTCGNVLIIAFLFCLFVFIIYARHNKYLK